MRSPQNIKRLERGALAAYIRKLYASIPKEPMRELKSLNVQKPEKFGLER